MDSRSEQVLIVAPLGQDARLIAAAIIREGLSAKACVSIEEACQKIPSGAGVLLVAEEALEGPDLAKLLDVLKAQPPWSALPVIVLTSGGELRQASLLQLAMSTLGAVTLLERPMRPATLVASLKVALGSRRRQYQVRDLIDQQAEQQRQLAGQARLLELAKEELGRANEALERKVEERTAKLKDTIEELERLSYSISHDMRGPLRAMQGFAQAVLEEYGDKLDDQALVFLQRIVRASVRQDRLIQDVLTYTRVVGERVNLEPINLDELVRDILQEYPNLQPPRLQVEVQNPLGSALGHEVLLTQCLSNLLDNAAKFTPPGQQSRVWVRTQSTDDDVRLWIEDNGIGIAPEHQQRIFALFERIHAYEQYEGTGLGLALVRKAVERMGGSVGVLSEVGQGSRFWIQLRAAGSHS